MTDFNAQMHWAHRQREDGRHSPDEVLGGARGVAVDEETLRRTFFTLRIGRVLDARGYARLRHWKVYGERGLAGRPVGLWLYGPQLTVEHRDEPLAQFHVAYAPGKWRLKTVTLLRLFETPFRSPQLWLFPLDDGQWRKVFRVATYAGRQRPRTPVATQLALFPAQSLSAPSS